MMAGMVRTMVCAFAASALAFLATAHADGLVANNIATGESHACAVAPSGEVVCWGSDASGQVSGTAAGTRVQRPMIVPGLTGVKVVEVSAGTDGTCALETTGAVWCWGNNGYGQLGHTGSTQTRILSHVWRSTGNSASGARISTSELMARAALGARLSQHL